MNQKLLYDFAETCVEKLGTLVGEMRKQGSEIGLTEEQTRKVWTTAFEVLARKHKISRRLMSQNLKQKATPVQEVASK